MKVNDIAALLNEPACSHNLKSKSGCAEAQAGSHGRGLHLRWRPDRLVTHRRCGPYRSRPYRLRRQFLGQPRHSLDRT